MKKLFPNVKVLLFLSFVTILSIVIKSDALNLILALLFFVAGATFSVMNVFFLFKGFKTGVIYFLVGQALRKSTSPKSFYFIGVYIGIASAILALVFLYGVFEVSVLLML